MSQLFALSPGSLYKLQQCDLYLKLSASFLKLTLPEPSVINCFQLTSNLKLSPCSGTFPIPYHDWTWAWSWTYRLGFI